MEKSVNHVFGNEVSSLLVVNDGDGGRAGAADGTAKSTGLNGSPLDSLHAYVDVAISTLAGGWVSLFQTTTQKQYHRYIHFPHFPSYVSLLIDFIIDYPLLTIFRVKNSQKYKKDHHQNLIPSSQTFFFLFQLHTTKSATLSPSHHATSSPVAEPEKL